jgi:cystathionine beta-lyase/cystathionine gamma-synthase
MQPSDGSPGPIRVVTLARTRRPPAEGAIPGSALERSFDEVAEDLHEIAWLAEGVAARVRERGRSIVRLHRSLFGDSVDVVERHQRAVVSTADAIRRRAGELRLDARQRGRTAELLAGITAERLGLADQVRSLDGIAAAVVVAMEWQSPSFGHSRRSNAGTRVGRVRPHEDDYRRDRHAESLEFERAYVREYVGGGARVRAFATSCGMSAFTTILAFLEHRHRLEGRVLVGASTYHECRDRLIATVPRERLILVDEAEPTLLAAISRERPSVIALDTVANAPGVATPSVRAVIAAADRLPDPPSLVLDNTGRSSMLRPFELPRTRTPMLVFESLTKYPQFGLDRVTGGIIVAEHHDADAIDSLREHLGTNIPDASAAAMPTPDRARLDRRLGRIGRNAALIARRLLDEADSGPIAGVDQPGLRGDGFGGWCVLRFAPEHDRPAQHDRFVHLALQEARHRGVPLVAGASFGLDVTRVYATGTTSASARPFVRISTGIEHEAGIEALAGCFIAAARHLGSS